MITDKKVLQLTSPALRKELTDKNWPKEEPVIERLRRLNNGGYNSDVWHEAKALREQIVDGVEYGAKLPRQSWEKAKPTWITLASARAAIESDYRASSEPYVQLVEIAGDGAKVIAEYMPGKGWVSPLEAAGYVSHPVRA
jgi:hypothetical protein